MAHPKVMEASAIAIPDEKWQERPLAAVVPTPDGKDLTAEELVAFLSGRVAKWWLPDDYVFVTEIPKTSTGKFSKRTLRDRYAAGEVG